MAFELSGASSAAVNSQLVPSVRPMNYFPRPLSAVGPGGQGMPAYPPQSSLTSAVSGPSSAGGSAAAATSAAASNPWSPVTSPVPWLVGFFIAAVLLFKFVHHG